MAGFLVPQRDKVVWRGTFEDLLPENHLARFIWSILGTIDFSELEGRHRSINGGPGRPPYHPRLLAALWIYGLTQGVEKATKLAQACQLRDDFRWLAGGLTPCDQTLLNFLNGAEKGLTAIWDRLLKAMYQEGLIDLSAIFEDGTKQRANASPKSFHNANEIEQVIVKLRNEIAKYLEAVHTNDGEPERNTKIDVLKRQLKRAEQAACELDERMDRRKKSAKTAEQAGASKPPKRFGRDDFFHDRDRNVLICPAGEELRQIGVYPTNSGKGTTYSLYGRSNCTECSIKDRCTSTRRRRIKIIDDPPSQSSSYSGKCDENDMTAKVEPAPALQVAEDKSENNKDKDNKDKSKTKGPQASLTEPEALMMLATSEKVWQPSYNADISVTRDGIIVSQFLTKRPTDFHHFGPALKSVQSVLRTPDAWVGDGHYGTYANLLLAHSAEVLLYAASTHSTDDNVKPNNDDADASSNSVTCESANKSDRQEQTRPKQFGRTDFRYDAKSDVMICPADQELPKVGVYPTENGLGSYRLYRCRDCRSCSLKTQCTTGNRRSIKVIETSESLQQNVSESSIDPSLLASLIEARDQRLKSDKGLALLKERHYIAEQVNGQLKAHGLSRFHVHGLIRASNVLTLACIGHNLMKWKARRNADEIVQATA
jgi:transposase